MKDEEKALLKKIPLFEDLDEDAMKKVISIARKKIFRKNEIIFEDGDEAESFYIILSGQVKIYKLSNDGKEQILHIIEKGESFGEAALFSGGNYPAYAEAIEDSMLISIPKDQFLSILKNTPELSLKMLASLSRYLIQFNRMIEELSLKEVSSRLAGFLLDEIKKNKSIEAKDNVVFEIGISKVQLARKLGTVNETLYRTFKKMKEKGIIDFKGKKVKIINAEKLKALAEGKKR
ncbi:MAG: Crp/Fnr family transcriptional regulator [Candidatus Schekmanbacteria bacterium]|nr:MAG: Crp/Fnr family transcriptional regulator [Candidatus Schekmanbacteria bacterium]